VLLVDDGSGPPITAVAHGHDQETQLSIDGPAGSAERAEVVIWEAVRRLAVPAGLG
jgi:hypothetical protein